MFASKLQRKDLLFGLREKSEDSLRQLVDQYSEVLYRIAFRILRQGRDSQEILREAYLKVISKIDKFQGTSTLTTWIYRMILNEALIKKRVSSTRPTVFAEDYLPRYQYGMSTGPCADWSRFSEELFGTEDFQSFLCECVEELPEDLKTAYVLKDEEGLTEEEVCDVLRISQPAMKGRVHRARLVLRKRIEEKYAR